MIGKRISHYELTDRVSEGGMGTVYKAVDLTLQRTVAVKVIKPSHQDPAIASKRFLREAQAVSQIHHPNVITLHDIIQEPDASFLIMEYIAGPSLRDRIKEGPMEPCEAARIACEVASALIAAHELGVVHRDIKPENVVIDEKGLCKVLDFGVAHLAGRSTLTSRGRIIGTAPYMAPEQIMGKEVDARTDVYAVGVLLYEMVAGKLPFDARQETALYYQIIHIDAPPLSEHVADLPKGIEAIVRKALAKDPAKRYQTATDMLHDLKIVCEEIDVDTRPSGRMYAKTRLRQRVTRWSWGLGIFLVVLTASQSLGPDWMSLGRLWKKPGPAYWLPVDKHVLVMPFTSVGDDPAGKILSDGLMETLTSMITQMEQFEGSLWVVPSSEVRQRAVENVGEAQRAFGVNLVISGSVQRVGGVLRLTLNLVDADTERQLTSKVIDAPLVDISVLQNETVVEVARMLDLELRGEARRMLTEGGTRVPGAYEYYLLGLGYLQSYESEGSIDNAVSSFEQAIDRDETYALAYAGLGAACWRKYELSPGPGWVERARENCNKALEISDQLAPVYVTLGITYLGTGRYALAREALEKALEIDPESFNAKLELAETHLQLGDAEAAERTFKGAIDLRPNYWGGYSRLGFFYYRSGRLAEAVAMFSKVSELTPKNIRAYNNLIGFHFMMGDTEKARAMFEKSIAVEPNATAYNNMATVYIYERRYADAIPMLERAIELGEDSYTIWGNLADSYRYTPEHAAKAPDAYHKAIRLAREQLFINPNSAVTRSAVAVYHAKCGEHDHALTQINEARTQAPHDGNVLRHSALVYELAGQREKALQAIEQALTQNVSVEMVDKDPEFAELRKDERYQKLIND